MSSKIKAKPQTFSSGNLYGSATTDKYGTTYNPSDFETKLINMTGKYIPQYMEQLVNPTYNSNIFKAQTAQRNRLANQSFENDLINPLASRGLTRGSSINQMSGQFAGKLADLETDAMANENTRNANMLNNLFGYYQVPYSNMMGIGNLSGNLYQQALRNAQNANEFNSSGISSLASMLGGMNSMGRLGGDVSKLASKSEDGNSSSSKLNWGNLLGAGAGYYFGGPAGGQIGSVLGGQLNNLF